MDKYAALSGEELKQLIEVKYVYTKDGKKYCQLQKKLKDARAFMRDFSIVFYDLATNDIYILDFRYDEEANAYVFPVNYYSETINKYLCRQAYVDLKEVYS